MRKMILEGVAKHLRDLSGEWRTGGALLSEDDVRIAPYKGGAADMDYLLLTLVQEGDAVDDTPDNTKSTAYIMQEMHTVQIECFGPRAWNWLHAYLNILQTRKGLEAAEALNLVIQREEGITDITLSVGADKQIRGVTTVKVATLTITEQTVPVATTLVLSIRFADLDLADPVYETSLEVEVDVP